MDHHVLMKQPSVEEYLPICPTAVLCLSCPHKMADQRVVESLFVAFGLLHHA
uniref:Uncharacterized protein n=1 Tax=Anguilla anguilla TaxID=7936 RepID=A0A0E9XZQ9_ANGAN